MLAEIERVTLAEKVIENGLPSILAFAYCVVSSLLLIRGIRKRHDSEIAKRSYHLLLLVAALSYVSGALITSLSMEQVHNLVSLVGIFDIAMREGDLAFIEFRRALFYMATVVALVSAAVALIVSSPRASNKRMQPTSDPPTAEGDR